MNVARGEKRGKSAVDWPEARRRVVPPGLRWGSLVASIAGGALVGAWLWSLGTPAVPGRALLEHVQAEAGGVVERAPRPAPGTIDALLEASGLRLAGPVASVVFARACRLRGRDLGHLVLRDGHREATLLTLPQVTVEHPIDFAGDGLAGRLLPAARGSLAIVVPAGTDLAAAAAWIATVVQWQDAGDRPDRPVEGT